MVIVFPSTYPSSRSPCRNLSTFSLAEEREPAEPVVRYPIRGIFFAAARRLEWKALRAKRQQRQEQSAKRTTKDCFSHQFPFTFFSRSPPMLPAPSSLLFDDSIRPRQHVGRNRQTDLFCRLQADHKFELRRLLDGKIGGLGPL